MPAKPEGIVRGKVDDNGVLHIAIVMAPKRPGEPAPSLSELEAVDLFDRTRIPSAEAMAATEEVRHRASPLRAPGIRGDFSYSFVEWILHSNQLAPHFPNSELVVGPVNGVVPQSSFVGYSSCKYVAYDQHVDLSGGRTQLVTFGNGTFQGTAEITKQGSTVYAAVNGGGRVIVAQGEFSANPIVGIILPVAGSLVPEGLGRQETEQVVGTWTLSATPPLTNPGQDPADRTGSTPFDFHLRALVIDKVVRTSSPSDVEEGGEVFSGGATFSAEALVLPQTDQFSLLESQSLHLAYKADIIKEGGGLVATVYGRAPAPGSGVTRFEIPWDGMQSNGSRAPGNTEYGVSVRAVLDTQASRLPSEARGVIKAMSPGLGPEGFDFGTSGAIEVTPNPYIPYTAEELQHTFDEDGNPAWFDDDGDGEWDRFPDHDNDGEPDFYPGEEPPGITISADLYKPGYTLSQWELNIFAEDGRTLHTRIETNAQNRFGFDNRYEWRSTEIPPDLEPQELKVEIIPTYCRRLNPELQILGQGTPAVVCSTGLPVKSTFKIGEGSGLTLAVQTTPEFDPENPFLGGISSGLIGISDPGSEALEEILANVCRDRRIEITAKGLPKTVTSIVCIVTNGRDVKSVQLSRSSDPDILEGKAEIPESFIDATADFCSLDDEVDGEIGLLFSTLMNFLPSSSTFPAPRVSRGRTVGSIELTTSELKEMLNNNVAQLSMGTMRSCGFQKMRAQLEYTPPGGEKVTAVAEFKVQNPASSLLIFANNKGEKVLAGSDYVSPLTMALSGVNTVIVGGGDALRIRNYDIPRHVISDSKDSPWGAIWDAKRGSSSAVFMGYRHQAPNEVVFKRVLADYFERVKDLEARGVTGARRKAWLLANYEEDEARQACVLDNAGFHYIHGGWEYHNSESKKWRPDRRAQARFVSVSASNWSRPRPPGIDVPKFYNYSLPVKGGL